MITPLLLGALALVALMFAADVAVSAARSLARSFGMSELLVGLTVTSVGTSLPELATTVAGALASGGEGGAAAGALSIGNVLGSNVFMLSFLLGLTGVIAPLTVHARTVRREGFAVVASTLAMFAVIVNGTVGRGEGAALVVAFGAYLVWVVRQEWSGEAETSEASETEPVDRRREGLLALGGMAVVLVAADAVVDQGVALAEALSVPGALVGVFVGIGTSLPEVVVSVQAARQGASDMSLGNLLGSSITNILLCLGLAGLIHPIPVPALAISFDWPFTATVTLVALALIRDRHEVTRYEGSALLILFALYLYLRTALIR